jgi:hypothetical protein
MHEWIARRRSENDTNFSSNAQQKAATPGGQRGALQFSVRVLSMSRPGSAIEPGWIIDGHTFSPVKREFGLDKLALYNDNQLLKTTGL